MNKNLCILPWLSIEVDAQGHIKPCCLYNDKNNLTNLDTQTTTLSEAFNSTYMNNLRNAFIAGEKPIECATCWNEEKVGRFSKRINSYKRLKPFIDDIDFSSTNGGKLKFLDLKLGNICNLKCRICGSHSSSKWSQEEIEINGGNEYALSNLKKGRWVRETNIFWKDLIKLLETAKYFEFTGGEPFLIEEHFELLEKAVSLGYSKNIEIHYNTNGTQFPKQALEIWSNFKLVEIAFSIDDLGARFEYQRYGAKWEQVSENLSKFYELKNNCKNIILQLCMTSNIQNFYYIDEICEWIHKQPMDSVYFNLLQNPWYFAINNLNIKAKTIILDKLKNYNGPYDFEVKKLLNFMEIEKDNDTSNLVEILKKSDQFRNQKFSDHHPEIAAAIGYE